MLQTSEVAVSTLWEPRPQFRSSLRNPLLSDRWVWRLLPPGHPALQGPPAVLRRNDPGDAFGVIARQYGEPTSYRVVGGNVASMSNWAGLRFDDQYRALHSGAGVFPCGGMYYLSVTGPGAADVLNELTPKRVDTLDVGQAVFAIFTTPEGTVDTEGVILRDGADSFQVSLGGETTPPTWLHDALDGHPGARAQEADIACFNIKGPERMAAMAALLHEDDVPVLATLAPFRGRRLRTRSGGAAWVLRTVIGIEMWAAPDVMHEVWQVMVADRDRYVPCGWDVLDTYRVESTEFAFYLCPIDIHRGTYLHDAGLGHIVSRGKPGPYIGREALEDPARWGGRMWIGGLTAVDPDAPARQIGDSVVHAGSEQPGGFVTSAGWSPREGRQLCFAHLAPEIRPGDVVRGADGATWRVSPLPMRPAVPAG